MDVLATGVQTCGETEKRGGLALFDVSDPARPKRLSFLAQPAGGVHELDLVVRRDGRVLALLAVPFADFEDVYFGANHGGEFRIVDVTDPRQPSPVDNWSVIKDSPLANFAGNDPYTSPYQGLGYFAALYAHSARAADGGMTAYVSYWDAGILKFDISDPAHPRLIGRTTYGPRHDGDGHSMTPYVAGGTRYILQNDEDESPLSPTIMRTSLTGTQRFAGIEEPWAPTLLSDVGTVRAAVFDAGDGCQAGDWVGARGKIALADTVDPFYAGVIADWMVPCSIEHQTLLAARHGARVFLSNLVSRDDAWPFGPDCADPDLEGEAAAACRAARGMPIVQISDIDDQADRIRRALKRGRTVTVTLRSVRHDFGFLRVYRESNRDLNGDGVRDFQQVGSYRESGDTIHNTEVRGNRAYSSWYTNGIVALNVSDPTHPRKVGQFIPTGSTRFPDDFGPDPFPLVWGVAIDNATGLIYASDMRSGLWIVRPLRAARPTH
jgi:hypothetical protein